MKRWFPLALFLALFFLPNLLNWVDSPALDYWGMLVVAILFVVSYPGPRGWLSSWSPPLRSEASLAIGVSPLAWMLLIAGVVVVLPYSAILLSLREGGFTADIREQSLKLAPVYVPVIVNLFRDAVLPFLIIMVVGKGNWVVTGILWLIFIFFATFNLAKSFIIINTLAILMAILASPLVGGLVLAVLLVPAMLLLAWLYGGEEGGVLQFLLDFVGRRILTLTAELGMDVRDFVDALGMYWGGGFGRDFEMELYGFIQHSDLESGWANVYLLADAYGRGGVAAMALAVVLMSLYLVLFRIGVAAVEARYSLYLWALLCIYVFMQGIFSLGLVVSFLAGPGLVLAFRRALINYGSQSDHGRWKISGPYTRT